MNIRMGGQLFADVSIPLLWGRRAVVQDQVGRLSIIDLSRTRARLEVLADKPAPGVEFVPDVDGFRIRDEGRDLYRYNPKAKQLAALAGALPEVQLTPTGTRVGSNFIGGGTISGFGVGISVQEDSMSIGGPLPPGLAALVV